MFNERLKQARINMGLSQVELANKIGISKDLYNKYERTQTKPNFKTTINLARELNVSVDYLLGLEEGEQIRASKVLIPVLGKIQAGVPTYANEDIIEYEEIPEKMAKSGTYYALTIKGKSMEPKFSQGDIVIIKKQSYVSSGDIAAVLIGNQDATIKKITKQKDGILLSPTNPTFDPIFYTKEEINNLPVVILGKVIELRAKF